MTRARLATPIPRASPLHTARHLSPRASPRRGAGRAAAIRCPATGQRPCPALRAAEARGGGGEGRGGAEQRRGGGEKGQGRALGRCFRLEGAHKLRPVCRHRCNATQWTHCYSQAQGAASASARSRQGGWGGTRLPSPYGAHIPQSRCLVSKHGTVQWPNKNLRRGEPCSTSLTCPLSKPPHRYPTHEYLLPASPLISAPLCGIGIGPI